MIGRSQAPADPARSKRRRPVVLQADAYYTRRLRRHLLLTKSGELLTASDSLDALLEYCFEHGIETLQTKTGEVTLTLRRSSPLEQEVN